MADEVELRLAALRKEDLVRVADRYLAAVDLKDLFARSHRVSRYRDPSSCCLERPDEVMAFGLARDGKRHRGVLLIGGPGSGLPIRRRRRRSRSYRVRIRPRQLVSADHRRDSAAIVARSGRAGSNVTIMPRGEAPP